MIDNHAVFDSEAVHATFAVAASGADRFVDLGEEAAFGWVAPLVRTRPVLDLGVGLGRTTAFLRLLSDDYLAVDSSPRMVRAFRRRHPELSVTVGDARDLSELPSEHYGLVVFSFNGIDTEQREGRLRVLAEMRRLVAPGGRVVFSTLNRDGPSFRDRPWRLRTSNGDGFDAVTLRRSVFEVAARPRAIPTGLRHYAHTRRERLPGAGWAMAPMAAHDYAMCVHFTTLPDLRASLRQAGLSAERVFTTDGSLLCADAVTSTSDNFTVVAQRS